MSMLTSLSSARRARVSHPGEHGCRGERSRRHPCARRSGRVRQAFGHDLGAPMEMRGRAISDGFGSTKATSARSASSAAGSGAGRRTPGRSPPRSARPTDRAHPAPRRHRVQRGPGASDPATVAGPLIVTSTTVAAVAKIEAISRAPPGESDEQVRGEERERRHRFLKRIPGQIGMRPATPRCWRLRSGSSMARAVPSWRSTGDIDRSTGCVIVGAGGEDQVRDVSLGHHQVPVQVQIAPSPVATGERFCR
jgi:hypothetical protein